VYQKDNQRRQRHARNEADAAQAGYGVVVYLSAIGQVIQTLFLAEANDDGDGNNPAYHAQQERAKYEKVLCHCLQNLFILNNLESTLILYKRAKLISNDNK
jgi:hypothetical protein